MAIIILDASLRIVYKTVYAALKKNTLLQIVYKTVYVA